MVQIIKKLTPYNLTKMLNKKNEYIVIHYVGSQSSAKNNADYFANNRLESSAHYFVDSDSIYQSVEDNNVAWHCGGGLQGFSGAKFYGKCKNANSIGIEMCCFTDGTGRWFFTEATIKNTVDLVKSLIKKYNIPIGNVIRHYDVTGKSCPAPMVENKKMWDDFINRIAIDDIIELTSANDIVWELGHRGFVTDTKGMLEEMNANPNGRLYWLARKMLHYIRTKKL